LTAPVEVPFVATRATELPAALECVPPALLTASISPYAQAEACAVALTVPLGASFATRPARRQSSLEMSATISLKWEGCRVVRRGYPWLLPSRYTIHRNNAAALSRSPFRIGNHTAAITRPTAESPPHQTR
jgi:uncharacterized membrane protein